MMKWWKSLCRNHKGFTMVELICSVAIFSIIMTGVGSAMVISAKSYQRGNVELDLQQQAQVASNLLTNLIIDSDNVVQASGNTLIVEKVESGVTVTYTVFLDGNELKYSTNVDPVGGVLAENIAGFTISRVEGQNVDFHLKVEEAGRNYESDYHVTPRNEVSSGGTTLSGTVSLFVENELVLEPGQTYDLDVRVLGTTDTSFSVDNITDVSDTSETDITTSGSSIRIKVGRGEENLFRFNVVAGADSSVFQPVCVYVRRVTGVDVSGNRLSGDPAKAGAVYNVTAQTTGTRLAKVPGAWYDIDYVPTYPVTWELQGEGLPAGKTVGEYAHILDANGDTNNPYCKVELLQDIPQGTMIKVIAVAKHPEGQIAGMSTNKSGLMYRGAESVKGIYIIKKELFGSGFRRGEKPDGEAFQFGVGDLGGFRADGIKNLYKEKHPELDPNYINDFFNNQADFQIKYSFAQYNDDGSLGAWSTAIRTMDHGATAIMEVNETHCFLPDKQYAVKVELSIVGKYDNVKYWPFDDTPEEQYLLEFIIGKTDIVLDNSGEGGSIDNPKVVRKEEMFNLDISELVGFSNGRISEYMQAIVQKQDADGNWVVNYDGVGIQAPGPQGDRGVVFTNVKGQNVGTYRILFTLHNVPYYIPNGSTLVEQPRVNCNLYDEATGKGIFYLTVIE